jgi:hypothetical protein
MMEVAIWVGRRGGRGLRQECCLDAEGGRLWGAGAALVRVSEVVMCRCLPRCQAGEMFLPISLVAKRWHFSLCERSSMMLMQVQPTSCVNLHRHVCVCCMPCRETKLEEVVSANALA